MVLDLVFKKVGEILNFSQITKNEKISEWLYMIFKTKCNILIANCFNIEDFLDKEDIFLHHNMNIQDIDSQFKNNQYNRVVVNNIYSFIVKSKFYEFKKELPFTCFTKGDSIENILDNFDLHANKNDVDIIIVCDKKNGKIVSIYEHNKKYGDIAIMEVINNDVRWRKNISTQLKHKLQKQQVKPMIVKILKNYKKYNPYEIYNKSTNFNS